MTTKELAIAKESFSFTPATLAEAKEYAAILANSGMVPPQYVGKPDAVLVAVQFGRELGLSPLQAVQSLAVVNNRPTLWGDALPALAQSSPNYEYMKEYYEGEGETRTAVCVVKRRGAPEHTVRFGFSDARKAGLLSKDTYQKNFDRMVRMRARAFALRDQFSDVLRGVAIREEVEDYPRVVTEAEVMPRAVGEAHPPTPAPYPKSPDIVAVAATVEQPELGLTAEQVGAIAEETQAGDKTDVPPHADFISESQRKRLFVLLKESGKTHEDLKKFLELRGISGTKNIPTLVYEVVADFCKEKKA